MQLQFVRLASGAYPTRRLQKFVDKAWRVLRKKNQRLPKVKQLIIVFVSPAEIKKLNKKHRGKNRATDVLSFSPVESTSLGELILCPAVIRAQAIANEWSDYHEYAYMILHGILHLLGYDHEKDDKAARQMYRLQDDIFFSLMTDVKK